MRHLAKAIAVGLFAASTAQAQVLNFEGINAVYPSYDFAVINQFYNGGTSSQGTSGVNFGVQFSTNAFALCLNTLDNWGCSGTSRGGVGNAASRFGGLFFLDGAQNLINRAAGFTTGFSFFYTSPFTSKSFTVWSGLNGTGTNLGSLALGITPRRTCAPQFDADDFCPFVAAGLAFAGTASSVTFAGVEFVQFDDVTFGSVTPDSPPSVVPEPATAALMAGGLLLLGGVARRRRAKA